MTEHPVAPLRHVPYMGVIQVVADASALGFRNGHPDWCNLGQGQPEVGPMAGAPPRIDHIELRPEDHAYGPLEGIDALREAIAATYNRLYRAGRKPYTAAHVAVAQGGRLALTRAFAALGSVHVGYQVPDYTAYEDMFDLHLARLSPVPVATREEDGFLLRAAALADAVDRFGLSAFLLSNPCNPTGAVVSGDELAAMVGAARRRQCALVLDEFYSHFTYLDDGGPAAGPVSGAAFVDDPDRDPVLLFDGLTKSHRYPGWRVGWVVGPQEMVETIARTASAIDGGASRWAQRAALRALEPAQADAETAALRRVFAHKRTLTVAALENMGIRCAEPPRGELRGTFYTWASLAGLPAPFDDAMTFYRRALEHRVMTVPGVHFDVNPGKRRRDATRFRQWMRFSFGPPEDNLRMGLERLRAMLADATP